MTPARSQASPGTPAAILDVAEHLVQARGFNGFSYADIASELGITKAALHYHFAGKAALGESLITRYASRFREALASIDAGTKTAPEKLQEYCQIYRTALDSPAHVLVRDARCGVQHPPRSDAKSDSCFLR